jgi:hypothetical protein
VFRATAASIHSCLCFAPPLHPLLFVFRATAASIHSCLCFAPPLHPLLLVFPPQVSTDEAWALAMYLAPAHPTLFYHKLNEYLRIDRGFLVPFMQMLKLLLNGLGHLGPTATTVWRCALHDVRNSYPMGSRVTWWGFSSCVRSMDLLERDEVIGHTGVRTLFMIATNSAFDVTQFSPYQENDEMLLPPGLTFRVTGHQDIGDRLHVIQLAQVHPPHKSPRTNLHAQISTHPPRTLHAPSTHHPRTLHTPSTHPPRTLHAPSTHHPRIIRLPFSPPRTHPPPTDLHAPSLRSCAHHVTAGAVAPLVASG